MGRLLHKIKIEGFKSIEQAELLLGDLNVVIGANGSGKSNLIGVFRLIERALSRQLQLYVAGEPDRFLYHGREKTPTLSVELTFDSNIYAFTLKAVRETLIFEQEVVSPRDKDLQSLSKVSLAQPSSENPESWLGGEAKIISLFVPPEDMPKNVLDFVVYDLHDTSDSSPAKRTCNLDDNQALRPDASNLAAYLYWLQEKHLTQFRHIEEHIRLIAPFFDRFVLAPSKLNENKIKLEWRHKGSDAYFDAYALSDGTLRFMCLATLLLQPKPPALILLDEPELGLHPSAIRILAEMLEAASQNAQVILATQSVTLLNHFSPENVIVAENDGLRTTFERLDPAKLQAWTADFSLGELWEKNVFGGRP